MLSSLQVALKEWDTVTRALATGRQMVLLRKGGISEGIGGFEIEHRDFLLFPTFLHQNRAMLKPGDQQDFSTQSTEPDEIVLRAGGHITDIIQLQSRAQADAIDDAHVWTPPLIDMRFSYKPKNPLYLLIVRAFVLAEPVTIGNTPDYAGCKSWVPLAKAIEFTATSAIADEAWDARRRGILDRLNAASA